VFPLTFQKKYSTPGQADFSKIPMTASAGLAKFCFNAQECQMIMILRRASWSQRGKNLISTGGIC